MTNREQQPESQQIERQHIFADEETRWGYEAAETVSKLVTKLPPEDQDINMQPITFEGLERKDRIRGLSAVFTAGTAWGSDKKGVLLVPERTINILKELQLPFHVPPSSK